MKTILISFLVAILFVIIIFLLTTTNKKGNYKYTIINNNINFETDSIIRNNNCVKFKNFNVKHVEICNSWTIITNY